MASYSMMILIVMFMASSILGQDDTTGASSTATDEVEWVVIQELWYALRMQNATAGLMQSVAEQHVTTERIRTTEVMSITIKRGEDTVKLKFNTEMVEDQNGTVIYSGYTQQMAEVEISMSYHFSTRGITVDSIQDGREHSSTIPPLASQHLARWASRQYFLSQLNTGTKFINYNTIKPELGATLVNVSSTFVKDEVLNIHGDDELSTSLWQTTMDGMPLKVLEWCNEAGDVVRMEIESGAGLIEAILSTEVSANEAIASAGSVPELVDSTHVILSKPEPQMHSWAGAQKATLTITSKNGDILDLPTSGYQRVIMIDNELKIQVDITNPVPASDADLNDWSFINPSAMIDSDDEAVRNIAIEALGVLRESPSAPLTPEETYKRALLLRSAVKAHIKVFNLATGYASASETARRAEGDCSEHAVLLAALLRVDGIPSRMCSGLVYTERRIPAEAHTLSCDTHDTNCDESDEAKRYTQQRLQGSYAWHAWTQALIGDRWIDLDATLHNAAYSVGHLLMGTSALDDAVGHADEMKLVSLIGNLEVRVDHVG